MLERCLRALPSLPQALLERLTKTLSMRRFIEITFLLLLLMLISQPLPVQPLLHTNLVIALCGAVPQAPLRERVIARIGERQRQA